MASRRSVIRIQVRPSPAAGMPATMSSTMDSGSSVRGLSEVTMASPAPAAATLPISGRFVRSRSPPAPKTTMSRPG